jgi:hypothetical protein
MRLPNWYVSIAQPARWSVGAAIGFGALGAAGGFVEAVDLYPVTSWFGVTLYLAMIAGFVGLLLGLVSAFVLRRS